MKLITALLIILSTEFIVYATGYCTIDDNVVRMGYGSLNQGNDAKSKLIATIRGQNYKVKIVDKYIPQTAIQLALGRNDISFAGVFDGDVFNAYLILTPTKIQGFLGLKSCIDQGIYRECDLKNYSDKEILIAVIDGKHYKVDAKKVSKEDLDQAIFQEGILFYGSINGDTLILDHIVSSKYKMRCWSAPTV